ncbi:hypothetical protein BKA64DRAFT_661498 [Cadophora sp. MPI-SDFR-AT-0126]|nr:hypothetical protein BKA64DRAFT_661498 [Leotiomycetes sp. MPI-SDFR-AT-0126]
MSTSNDDQGESSTRTALRPDMTAGTHSTSYDNATSSGSMHAGHNYSQHSLNVVTNIHLPGPGNLDTSGLTSQAVEDASARSSLPLPSAIQDLRRPILVSPYRGSRLGASSKQLAQRKTRSYLNTLLSIFASVVAFVVLIVCFVVAIMFIFNSRHQSSFHTLNITHGFFSSWIDHSYPGLWKRRITVSDDQAQLLSGSIILLLTPLIPSAYVLLICMGTRLCTGISYFVTDQSKSRSHAQKGGNTDELQDQDLEENERTPLIGDIDSRREGFWSQIARTWSPSKSLMSDIFGLLKGVYTQQLRREPGCKRFAIYLVNFLLATIFSLVALAIFIALAFSTLLSAEIVTNSAVLSSHPDCGIWIRDSKFFATPSATGYDYLQEAEAAAYAKKCYHSSQGMDGCNSFLAQKIPYSTIHNSECPFEDGFCLDGRYSAYKLETGAVSSKVLGINVNVGYSFKRTTICSPIQPRASLSSDRKTYVYDYGVSKEFGNHSWASAANHTWEFAGYNVATLFYKRSASSHAWQPSSEFKPLNHDTITLLLIQSQRNLHTAPSHDPIFPAKRKLLYSNEDSPLYFNVDPISTALACVDTTEICTADGRTCYPDPVHPAPELIGHDEEVGYYMLFVSLLESSTFDAIQLLGGRALVASSKLERQVSLPLAEEQWKVEVENLFEATLARPQIALRDYIRGRAAHDPEYGDRKLAGMGDMCRTYKFPGRGWKSVSVWGIILIVFIAIVVFVLTIEVRSAMTENTKVEEVQELDDAEEEGGHWLEENVVKVLVAEWMLEKIYLLCSDNTGIGNGEDGTQRQSLGENAETVRDLPFANGSSRPGSVPASQETNHHGGIVSPNNSVEQDGGGKTTEATTRDETSN